MKPRLAVAAAALLALAGSIAPTGARLLAAEGTPVPAAAAPAVADDLPRFEPSPATIEPVSIPVVQPLPQEPEPADDAQTDAEGRAIGSGVASWYGREFAGRKTANGERFDPSGYTAAHRTLPFGSKVRVTRGGKSVVVRINDRGPFHGGRVIDLSRAAAAELGLVNAGRGQVELALVSE